MPFCADVSKPNLNSNIVSKYFVLTRPGGSGPFRPRSGIPRFYRGNFLNQCLPWSDEIPIKFRHTTFFIWSGFLVSFYIHMLLSAVNSELWICTTDCNVLKCNFLNIHISKDQTPPPQKSSQRMTAPARQSRPFRSSRVQHKWSTHLCWSETLYVAHIVV